jgi:hypothetical protein
MKVSTATTGPVYPALKSDLLMRRNYALSWDRTAEVVLTTVAALASPWLTGSLPTLTVTTLLQSPPKAEIKVLAWLDALPRSKTPRNSFRSLPVDSRAERTLET